MLERISNDGRSASPNQRQGSSTFMKIEDSVTDQHAKEPFESRPVYDELNEIISRCSSRVSSRSLSRGSGRF